MFRPFDRSSSGINLKLYENRKSGIFQLIVFMHSCDKNLLHYGYLMQWTSQRTFGTFRSHNKHAGEDNKYVMSIYIACIFFNVFLIVLISGCHFQRPFEIKTYHILDLKISFVQGRVM